MNDDVAATGVIAALLEQGVRVPDQLKLVVHKNSAVDIFCPLPATFIEVSTSAIAAALIGQVQKQFRGEPTQPVTVGFRVARNVGPAADDESVRQPLDRESSR